MKDRELNDNMSNKNKKDNKKLLKKILFGILAVLLVFVFVILIYFCTYYKAKDTAKKYMASTEAVMVSEDKEKLFFDGTGTENLLIFYIGAKVDEKSYSEMCFKLAENGVDVCVIKMPFHFAIFGMDKADDIRKEYAYANYYIGGHSLGGAMASMNVSKNTSSYKGIVLLGSYLAADLSNTDIKVLSVYGENDRVLNRESYDEAKSYNPKDFTEYVVSGGNHASFGDYGKQKGDGEVTIELSKQVDETVEQILLFIAN